MQQALTLSHMSFTAGILCRFAPIFPRLKQFTHGIDLDAWPFLTWSCVSTGALCFDCSDMVQQMRRREM
ncbi:hypothetical protein XA67_20055 [Comamonas thiooxydans]|nr:hypothetical protein XA67_20055 [Comamonas thiooxydans]